MQANGNSSYAQMRAGSLSGPTFEDQKMNAGSVNTDTPASLSAVNRSSTSFTFRSKNLSDKPQALSRATGGTFLDQSNAPGMAQ